MTARQRPPESPHESSEASERVESAKGAMDKFKALTDGLVKVTRSELTREQKRYEASRKKKREATDRS
jgi:hypothetical protein